MKITDSYHILPNNMVKGDIIRLKTSDRSHWTAEPAQATPESAAQNFATALERAMQTVNDQQVTANQLTQKMVADPKSVNVHNVMIAQEKARMSLTFTKSVVDLAVKAYRELVNLR